MPVAQHGLGRHLERGPEARVGLDPLPLLRHREGPRAEGVEADQHELGAALLRHQGVARVDLAAAVAHAVAPDEIARRERLGGRDRAGAGGQARQPAQPRQRAGPEQGDGEQGRRQRGASTGNEDRPRLGA
jgi:hypothetical protein